MRFAGEKAYKFEEILPIFKAVSSNPDNNPGTLAEFLEAFKTFDREGQGYINGAELRHVLKSLGMYQNGIHSCLPLPIVCLSLRF